MPTLAQIEAQERLDLMKLMDEGFSKIPKRQLDENLLIATWNIQQFSEKKTLRSLRYIADIIERFDIVAIQEIKTDLRGLAKLQELLPGRYRILVSDSTGNAERFAFIYDERSVQATGLVAELVFPLDAQHTGFQIHRTPYCASFRAGRFDFTIVSVHIFQSNEEIREKEIREFAKAIKKLSKREATKVFDRDFFVVGDFNIEKRGDEFFSALVDQGFCMPGDLANIKTNFSRTKTFDKIAWLKRPDFSFSGACKVVPFNKVLFQDAQPKGGRKEISDHLPLWAEFKINELTQELTQIVGP